MQFFYESELIEQRKYTKDDVERIEQAIEDIMPTIERFNGEHSAGYFAGMWMNGLMEYEDMSEDMQYDAACMALQRFKIQQDPEKYQQWEDSRREFEEYWEKKRAEQENASEGTTGGEAGAEEAAGEDDAEDSKTGLNDTHGPQDYNIAEGNPTSLVNWLSEHAAPEYRGLDESGRQELFDYFRESIVDFQQRAWATCDDFATWTVIDTSTEKGMNQLYDLVDFDASEFEDDDELEYERDMCVGEQTVYCGEIGKVIAIDTFF